MEHKFQLVDYLKNFPKNSTPRPQQKKALEEISRIFSKGKKFVIASLPTGSGKSHIAASVARSSSPIDKRRKELIESYLIYKKDKDGNYQYEDEFLNGESYGSYILTITKSLQDQYQTLFQESIIAKGKSNYCCAVDPNLSVDFAPCLYSPKLKEKCFELDRCPYYRTRNEAFASIDPILNYRAFINLPKFLRRREIYICDEASGIEGELVSQYTISINYSFLESEGIPFKKLYNDDSNSAMFWLQDIYQKLKSELDSLKVRISNFAKSESHSSIKIKEMQKLGKFTNIVNSIEEVLRVWEDCEYLVEHRDHEKVTFVPYDIKPLAKKLFDGADMILMMSATISNHAEFAKSLGIQECEYEYIEVPSVFDSSKSPIKSSRKYNLSYKNNNKDLPKILEAAIEICNMHKGEKGIIHTHTNQITEELKKKVKDNDRFIFREIGKSNEAILLEHKERLDDDTILVSPSLDTGVSLDDELGRFQIIIKAPFLPLNSKRIKKIYDKNKNYYMMKMLNTLVQMCGRCTRSEKDHSVTYILDGNAVNSILINKKHLPKHFIERLV
jgi:ATP-dependent DNA helicase DinG